MKGFLEVIELHSPYTFWYFREGYGGITSVTEHHTVLGGKVHVYKRPNSSSWQCSTFMGGRNRRRTTKGR